MNKIPSALLHGLRLRHSRILNVERVKSDRAILEGSIERAQHRPRSLLKPSSIHARRRRRTNNFSHPATLDLIIRHIINLENPFLDRIATICYPDTPAGKTSVDSQLLHLLLDHRAVNASSGYIVARCVSAVCICSEGRKKDADCSASDLDARAVDIGVGHCEFDPVLEVYVDAVGGEVELGTPNAAAAI